MKNFILKLINSIFNIQENISTKYKKINTLGYSNNSMLKNHIVQGASLTLSTSLEKNKERVDFDVEKLASENIDNIENILNFSKEKGVEHYFISNPDRVLSPIGESEGIIFPLSGLKAVSLNLILENKISFKTDLIFVFDRENKSPYTILYNFYKWYSLKLNLPGFDRETLLKFKHIEDFEKEENLERLSYNDIMDLKQAIARDREAMEFVIKFMKKKEGAKNAFSNLKNKNDGTNI